MHASGYNIPDTVVDISLKKFEKSIKLGTNARDTPIVLTSGEPTLVRDFPIMVEKLRNNGFRNISLQTNGRMLAYMDYCARLIKAGITNFVISIHGSKREIHEALTRTPHSFEQTLCGLENILKLREYQQDIVVQTATTLTKINTPHLTELIKFLLIDHSGISTVILNPLILSGNALNYSKQLAISYTNIKHELLKAVKNISPSEAQKISVIGLPMCIDSVFAGPFGNTTLVDLKSRKRKEYSKRAKKNLKKQQCKQCKYFSSCSGISPEYIKLFGWSEFKPVLK